MLQRSAILLCLGASALGANAQMFTAGEFNVTPAGAASYHVPIKVPPGVAGMQPDLALNYNSQSGNGLLGIGWSLSGLSAIVRCPKTMSQDGVRGSVNFDVDDRYCLDGQRLIAVRDPANSGASVGDYGANGTFYTTEQEGFNKIQSFGSVGSGTAPTGKAFYGPAYFTVKSKAGLTMEYGNTADSRVSATGKTVVRMWALNKISDSKGNYLSITYSPADSVNGQSYPTAITYTANDSTTPVLAGTNRINFIYNDQDTGTMVTRPDVSPSYAVGSVVQNTVRLTNVSISVSGTTVREYKIGYGATTSAPSSSLITSIKECAAGLACLPALSFGWSNLAPGWSMATWPGGPQPGPPISGQCFTGDFDGDSRTDLACFTGVAGRWQISLSTGTSWSTLPDWTGGPTPGTPIGEQCVTGDFDGNGKTDIACYTGGGGSWHVALSTGSGWSTSYWNGGNSPGLPIGNQCIAADVNGDGKTDIVCYAGSSNFVYSLSTGSGWQNISGNGGNAPGSPLEGNQCFSGDFNGDGKTDLACNGGAGSTDWPMSLSNASGNGWTGALWRGGNAPGAPNSNQCMTGDFNGDGKTDIVCYPGSGSQWVMQLSTGAGWATTTWGNSASPGVPVGNQCMTADLNGDGKTDMACYSGTPGSWAVTLSTGTGWVNQDWRNGNSPGFPIGAQCVPGDFNGDGKTDILCYPGSGSNWVLSSPSTTPYALLTSVTNGGGVVITPTYNMLARTLGTRFTRTVALTAPQYSTVPALPVVTDVDFSNGIGGTRRTSYWYDTAVTEIGTGRGYLGFKSVLSQDMSTNMQTKTVFRTDFPYIGLADVSTTSTGSGALLSKTTNTYSCLDASSGMTAACSISGTLPTGPVNPKPMFVYPNQIEKRAWDLNGAGMPGSRVTNASIDAYGNFGSVTTKTLNPDGSDSEFSKVVTSTYYNDPTRWYLGRLTKSVVVASGPTVPAAVVAGSGNLPPTPGPSISPSVLMPILNMLLDD